MQLMRLSAQCHELFARGVTIHRLGKAPLPERQRLVGAEHQPAGALLRHRERLFARQPRRNRTSIRQTRFFFQRAFVDVGGYRFDRNVRAFQHQPPNHAAGSKHQRLIGKPQRHGRLPHRRAAALG
jgi:hypothetical protein